MKTEFYNNCLVNIKHQKPNGFLQSLIKIALLFSVVLFFFSCENSQSDDNNYNASASSILPKAYVLGVTEGNIASSANIRIDFSIDIELIANGGDIINEDIFSFNPKIEGKVYWNSNSSIIFKPNKPLENGMFYKGSVDLSKLFTMRDGQDKEFNFSFRVIPMQISVRRGELQPYAGEKSQLNFLDGTIISSDVIDDNIIPKLISASQDGEKLEISYSDSDKLEQRNFKIENIKRKDKESKVVIKWSGKKAGSPDGGIIEVLVPPLNVFELSSVKVVNTPTQLVEITFSDPIDKSMNLNGIVYLTDNQDVKYEVDLNKITIYPNGLQKGDAVLAIKKELRNIKGVSIDRDYLKNIYFGQIKPSVKFIDDGVVMPGKNNWLVHFKAVNLAKVDVVVYKIFANNIKQFLQVNELDGNYQLERVSQIVHQELIDLDLLSSENDGSWNNYAFDLSKMIKKDEQGIYRVQIKFKKDYSLYNCDGVTKVDDSDNNNYGYNDYYKSEYYYPAGFRWDERENPCSDSYFYYERFVQKNVMASNIALTVKGNEKNGYSVFATDLLTANEIEGLDITAYNYQLQPITTIKTNSNGISNFILNEEAWLFVAQRSNEFAYVKVVGGNSLSYSRFDTKGVQPNNGIDAFIYGDRGVWRPGDTLFLTMIAMNADGKLPENHPATVKLFNPKSKMVVEKTLSKSVNGFYAFAITTSQDDLTGVWRAQFTLGGSVFTKRVRIEDIKPNRLKIALNFARKKMLVAGNNSASVNVKWLHGGIASGLRTEIVATLRTANTVFDKYKNYNFNDVGRYFAPDEVTVLDKKLNKNGNLNFNVRLPSSKRAPGKLKVTFFTKVFEKGGDFSVSQDYMMYSPFNSYVGIQVPKDKNGSDYLEVDEKHTFDIATVNSDGNPVSIDNLEVEIYKISWSWWYANRNRSTPGYIQADYNNRVYSKTISSKNGKASFDFEISYPMWGNYYVKVSDPESGHSCGTKFYMDWPSSYSRKDRVAPGDASLLSLSADKKKYNVGDTVKVSLPTPANSNMLVSLETNDRIIKTWWQKTTDTESVIKFVADNEMTPNIYAVISVIQPFDVNNNDLPVRMYGVIPIMVEDKQTVLNPVLGLPSKIKPNSKYTIKVSEQNNKKMTYTIAVVDEGLLDITNFKTPNPHKSFYAKQALTLQTWDGFDYVMAAFKGNITRTFAIGGSDMEDDTPPEKKKANRFKPVVKFLGPFTLEAGAIASHDVMMTNYIGSVRVMLVAGNDGAFGDVEKTVPVKQPLMVLTTMPRVLSPSEKIVLPVTVFAMSENIKKVNVEIITNSNFDVKVHKKQIDFTQVGEKTIFFDVDVADFDGVGELKAVATSGNESSYNNVEILIRNPNPRVYKVKNFKIDKGDKLTYIPEFNGVPNSYELLFSISSMPQINLESRMKYLISYPYHCLEQTTSSAFPQLFLSEMTKLSDKQKQKIEKHVSVAIGRIMKMQQKNGGFSYWPGNYDASSWGTSYAGHFLLKAKDYGYSISNSLLKNWETYQNNKASNWSPYTSPNGMIRNDLTQAYRLFTLALAGTPNLAAMNRMREMKGLHIQAKYQLASAYALVGQKNVAKMLIKNATYEVPVRSYWRRNYGSETRDKAMMVETLYLLDDESAIPMVMDVAADLRSSMWMSTQTTAFSLNAISLFTKNNKLDEAYSFKYKYDNGWSDDIIPSKPIYETTLNPNVKDKLRIENTSNADVFVAVTTSAIPNLGDVINEQKNLKLVVTYKNMAGNIIDVSNLEHGLDFYAEIVVTNTGKFGDVDNMALSNIFPSGWEIINTRMFDVGAELKSDKANYIDYRDDRVDFFFGLKRGAHKRFVVLLNAAYRGKYYMPATQCSDMYNNNVAATVGGGWVVVE